MATRLIGYWHNHYTPEWPDPRRFVDETQNPQLRERVVAYLQAGEVYAVSPGCSFCRLCGERNGDAAQSDGYYDWPSGLDHYVEVHAIRLPDEFVSHVLANKPLLPPPEFGDAIDDSWWKAQLGWHDGAGVKLFGCHESRQGSIWLTHVRRPITAAQLRLLRRFPIQTLGTRELLERLQRRNLPWEIDKDRFVHDAQELQSEADALGLTLEFRSNPPRHNPL
jgi:hypothetical protein